MHPNPAFRRARDADSLAFARDRGFGTLVLADGDLPQLAHVPFLIDPTGTRIYLHLVRSNPIVRLLRTGARPARLAVLGPDGYVSPDWYDLDDQVPTWNYVAVHVTGTLELETPEAMPERLAAQSAAYEARLEKPPWRMDKLTSATRETLMRQILPARLAIEDLQATWKLSQNKPPAARRAASREIGASLGAELAALARLMADPPPDNTR